MRAVACSHVEAQNRAKRGLKDTTPVTALQRRELSISAIAVISAARPLFPLNRHSPARIERPFRAMSRHFRRTGRLWNIARDRLHWLDVGRPDHLAPFLGFVGDQLAELGRRSRQRRAAEVSDTGLHLRIVESRVDLLVELVDDLGRRGPWSAEAVPITHLVARQELTHGRDVRQCLRPLPGGYCERMQPASPDILDGRRHCRKAYLYLPREEIGQSRPCAAIGHGHHINTSHYFEKLAGHMHRRT